MRYARDATGRLVDRPRTMAAGVDVVIVARNEASTIGDVVDAWHRAGRGQVIVVDDGSSDRTGEEAVRAGCDVLLRGPGQGKGAAMRLGLRAVSTPRVAFSDADLRGFGPEHVHQLLDAGDDGQVVGLRDGAELFSWLPPIGGERVVPTDLARSTVLDGWGAELALNAQVATAGLPSRHVRMPGVTNTHRSGLLAALGWLRMPSGTPQGSSPTQAHGSGPKGHPGAAGGPGGLARGWNWRSEGEPARPSSTDGGLEMTQKPRSPHLAWPPGTFTRPGWPEGPHGSLAALLGRRAGRLEDLDASDRAPRAARRLEQPTPGGSCRPPRGAHGRRGGASSRPCRAPALERRSPGRRAERLEPSHHLRAERLEELSTNGPARGARAVLLELLEPATVALTDAPVLVVGPSRTSSCRGAGLYRAGELASSSSTASPPRASDPARARRPWPCPSSGSGVPSPPSSRCPGGPHAL
jgi:hypothetical protein